MGNALGFAKAVLAALVLPLAAGCSDLTWSAASGPGAMELFDGRSLAGWKSRGGHPNTWLVARAVSLDAADPKKFAITPGEGILVNGPDGKTCDILTEQEFGDCELHVEFTVSKGSNSGVYLMGRYEIQILDSFGKDAVTFSDCGGIYARWINNTNVEGHPPRVNVSRAPGEWQSFDAIFLAPRFDAAGRKVANARFVKVAHNGVVVHENVSLNGPTRAALSETDEVARGPLLLQGDHGPVAFRNLRIRPLAGK